MTPLYLLTADVAATVLICPVVCAALPLTWRRAGAVLAIGVVWLLASAFALASMGMDATTVAVSHLVLAAATLAAAGVGHLGRAAFPHPLDAIAVALLASLVPSVGIFLAGRFAGDLTPDLLNAILAINPLVATAAAAGIDLFRTELLYRISPLPHLLFEYPSWRLSLMAFAGVAAAGFGGAWVAARRRAVFRHG